MTDTLDRLTEGLEENKDYRVFADPTQAARWFFAETEDDLQFLFHTLTQLKLSSDNIKDGMTVDEWVIRQFPQFTFLDDDQVLFTYLKDE